MPTVRWLDEREARAWRALMSMQMHLEAELARDLASGSPLSLSDYAVLVALTEHPEGRMRLFELGQALGWEKSRLSHHLRRMVDRGHVRKERCPSDRRGAFVCVTAKGRRAIEAAAPGHVAAVRRLVVDQLTSDELDALGAICEKVLAVIEARRGPTDPDAS